MTRRLPAACADCVGDNSLKRCILGTIIKRCVLAERGSSKALSNTHLLGDNRVSLPFNGLFFLVDFKPTTMRSSLHQISKSVLFQPQNSLFNAAAFFQFTLL